MYLKKENSIGGCGPIIPKKTITRMVKEKLVSSTSVNDGVKNDLTVELWRVRKWITKTMSSN